jgi:hypothetical protein
MTSRFQIFFFCAFCLSTFCSFGTNLLEIRRLVYQNGDSARVLALEYLQNTNNEDSIASIQNALGIIERRAGYLQEALEWHFKSMEMAEKLGHDNLIAYNLINIATIYDLKGNSNISREYYLNAIEYLTKINDEKGLSIALMNLGSSYFKEKNYKKSIEYFKLAEPLVKNASQNRQYTVLLANITMTFIKLNNIEQAIVYNEKTKAEGKELSDPIIKSLMAQNEGEILRSQNKLKEAEEFFKIAFSEAKLSKQPDSEKTVGFEYVQILKELNKHLEAFDLLEYLYLKSDSLNRENELKQNTLLLEKIEELSSRQEIKLLKQEAELKDKISVQKNYLILLGIIGFTLITAFSIYLRLKLRNIEALNNALSKEKEKVSQKSNLLLEANKKLEDFNAELEQKVFERTKEIAARNEQLEEFAFFNAHIYRAPVANLLGLIDLYDKEKNEKEKEQIIALIKDSIHKLEEAAIAIQNLVKSKEIKKED